MEQTKFQGTVKSGLAAKAIAALQTAGLPVNDKGDMECLYNNL